MKARCLYNKGEALRTFEHESLSKEQFGRFGASWYSEYGGIEIGKEYLVMGMIMFDSYLAYLVDDAGMISACPCQLFELIDDKICSNWHFRLIEKEENIYPFVQAIWGYYEFCFDRNSYENLIVEKDDTAQQLYFRRKMDIEKELNQSR